MMHDVRIQDSGSTGEGYVHHSQYATGKTQGEVRRRMRKKGVYVAIGGTHFELNNNMGSVCDCYAA
jgi:hypothetical protein